MATTTTRSASPAAWWPLSRVQFLAAESNHHGPTPTKTLHCSARAPVIVQLRRKRLLYVKMWGKSSIQGARFLKRFLPANPVQPKKNLQHKRYWTEHAQRAVQMYLKPRIAPYGRFGKVFWGSNSTRVAGKCCTSARKTYTLLVPVRSCVFYLLLCVCVSVYISIHKSYLDFNN